MTSRLMFLVSVTLILINAPLSAQNKTSPAAAPGMKDPQAMMQAYEAAQAAAIRPGDEKLNCKELQAQFTEIVNDPTIRANIKAGGEAAQRDMAAIEAAKRATPSTGASAAASMLPGGDWAAHNAAVAQAEAAKARGAGRHQEHAARAQASMESMPQMLRGQRLIELGAAKKCDWAAGVKGVK